MSNPTSQTPRGWGAPWSDADHHAPNLGGKRGVGCLVVE
jgi:hypothetical protein